MPSHLDLFSVSISRPKQIWPNAASDCRSPAVRGRLVLVIIHSRQSEDKKILCRVLPIVSTVPSSVASASLSIALDNRAGLWSASRGHRMAPTARAPICEPYAAESVHGLGRSSGCDALSALTPLDDQTFQDHRRCAFSTSARPPSTSATNSACVMSRSHGFVNRPNPMPLTVGVDRRLNQLGVQDGAAPATGCQSRYQQAITRKPPGSAATSRNWQQAHFPGPRPRRTSPVCSHRPSPEIRPSRYRNPNR